MLGSPPSPGTCTYMNQTKFSPSGKVDASSQGTPNGSPAKRDFSAEENEISPCSFIFPSILHIHGASSHTRLNCRLIRSTPLGCGQLGRRSYGGNCVYHLFHTHSPRISWVKKLTKKSVFSFLGSDSLYYFVHCVLACFIGHVQNSQEGGCCYSFCRNLGISVVCKLDYMLAHCLPMATTLIHALIASTQQERASSS